MTFPTPFKRIPRFLNVVAGMLLMLATMMEFIPSANAQQFTVGTGSAGNTYNRQFTEIQKVCGKELAMVEAKSNGAVKNAEMLLANEINGGWVQADILHMMARTQDLSDIKTLLVMHQESLHYIVKAAPIKVGGTLGFGAKEVVISDLSQLAGMTVAAAGGAAWTAKQVRLETEIQHNIVEVADSAAAIKALDAGQVNAALIVGGFPIDMVRKLGNGYRVLNVNDALQKKLAGAYLPTKVTYANLADGGVAGTVSVQALFVTREYKTPKMQNALAALRGCVLTNLDDIRETTGNHASWRMVKHENQSQAKWPLYKLPEATGSAPTPAGKKR